MSTRRKRYLQNFFRILLIDIFVECGFSKGRIVILRFKKCFQNSVANCFYESRAKKKKKKKSSSIIYIHTRVLYTCQQIFSTFTFNCNISNIENDFFFLFFFLPHGEGWKQTLRLHHIVCYNNDLFIIFRRSENRFLSL